MRSVDFDSGSHPSFGASLLESDAASILDAPAEADDEAVLAWDVLVTTTACDDELGLLVSTSALDRCADTVALVRGTLLSPAGIGVVVVGIVILEGDTLSVPSLCSVPITTGSVMVTDAVDIDDVDTLVSAVVMFTVDTISSLCTEVAVVTVSDNKEDCWAAF